ncbi:Flp pilus assembly protein CpaB [Marinobacter sp. F4206]|uniref:Flp pilus assembly protein CpaB n=1 Tax=Marinobacter sp. F4206 TaxID=2861777 RepID=UPI001C5D973A|nr:Flp pilus assembly protein CpaB [Marinobacter sp. F4206]MBW4933057.1 Flp pilus assembly protein CpaB [Marinobacter sp. F4206]
MFKKRTIVMLTFALAMGLAAAFVAKGWAIKRLTVQEEDAGIPVVVAAMQIPFGKKLEETDLRIRKMPEDLVPSSAYNDIESLGDAVATGTIYPDEIIMKEKVAGFGGGSALSAVIAPNKRAVTVRVNDVVGVAGFLMPGNRVDVVAAKPEGSHRKFKTETLLEDIKVLAVDQTASPEKDKPVIVRAVTLELTPIEAELLVGATQEGMVQLALRNPLDDSKKPEPKPEVVAEAPKPKPAPKRVVSRSQRVTVIRGTDVSTSRVSM